MLTDLWIGVSRHIANNASKVYCRDADCHFWWHDGANTKVIDEPMEGNDHAGISYPGDICGVMVANGEIHDADCNSNQQSLCQYICPNDGKINWSILIVSTLLLRNLFVANVFLSYYGMHPLCLLSAYGNVENNNCVTMERNGEDHFFIKTQCDDEAFFVCQAGNGKIDLPFV